MGVLAMRARLGWSLMARSKRAMRLTCDLPCEVVQNGAVIPGSVVNTSAEGLSVRVPGGFPFEGLVTVALQPVGLRFDAEVRWRRTNFAGLRMLRGSEIGARSSRAKAA